MNAVLFVLQYSLYPVASVTDANVIFIDDAEAAVAFRFKGVDGTFDLVAVFTIEDNADSVLEFIAATA